MAEGQSPQTEHLPKLPRKRRKRREYERRQKINLGTAEEILVGPLTMQTIEQTEFFNVLDNLVVLAALTVVNFMSGLIGEAVLGVRNSVMLPLAVGAILGAMWGLAKVELLADITPQHERMYIAGIATFLFAGCYSFLLFAPHWVVDFRLEASTQELGHAATKALSARLPDVQGDVPPVMFDPLIVFLPLSALCCVLGGLLFTPAVRAMRSQYLSVAPPQHLHHLLKPGMVIVLLLQLRFVVALLCIMAWLDPLVELLDAPAWLVDASKPLLFIIWALLQLAAFRPLVQGYLHTALVQWYNVKMGGGNKREEESLKHLIILKVQVNTFLLCRVAVQMLAPAVITGSCGLVMIMMRAWTTGNGGLEVDGGAFPGSAIYYFSGFCAWWTCMLWLIYSGLTLTLFRVGMLVI